jgi:uridine phosphorylase
VNRETHKFVQDAGEKEAIEVANEDVRILHQWDKIKKKKHKTNFFPSLLS